MLDKKYINSKFKLSDTNTIVILDGKLQIELSDNIPCVYIDNLSLKIPKNHSAEKPIHLLFINSQNYNFVFNIISETNSRSTIIEEHLDLNNDEYTSNIDLNITVKNNSSIKHYKLQTQGILNSRHQAKSIITQFENSNFDTTLINRGSYNCTESLHIILTEQKANFNAQGINTLCNDQKTTQKLLIEHKAPKCTSNVLFKGIVDNQATNTFDCLAKVDKDAIKTETHVTNKNLLLSESATANTSPELEIYADDVICTHGTTVGQLESEAIFYLRSRGLTKNSAEKLLTKAFVQEITEQFPKYDRLKFATKLTYE